jgi:hypothetical protein
MCKQYPLDLRDRIAAAIEQKGGLATKLRADFAKAPDISTQSTLAEAMGCCLGHGNGWLRSWTTLTPHGPWDGTSQPIETTAWRVSISLVVERIDYGGGYLCERWLRAVLAL